MPSVRDSFLAFDPNKLTQLPWATYAPPRGQMFKLHKTRATALNAMSGWRDLVALYQFAPEGWKLVARKDRVAENCTCGGCGGSTEESVGYQMYDTGRYDWQRDWNRRITDPLTLLYLCRLCFERHP